jgi:hypothetical protein
MHRVNIIRFAMALILSTAMPSLAISQDIQQDAREISQGKLPSAVDLSRPEAGLTNKFEYYDNGKVMACSKMTPDGDLAAKLYYYQDGKIRKEERYDKDGKKIEESNYDENGKLDDDVDGWAAKRWAYKDGILRIESIYGEDGHITERKIYNDLGDMTDRQYVGDGKIDPTEEFNSGSIVNRETDHFYDEYGNSKGSVTTEVDDAPDIFDEMYWDERR